MKNIYKTLPFLFFLLPILLQAQNRLVNNGARINVGANVDLRVDNGSITNKNNGQINNNGNIYLDLEYNQNTTATYTGGTASWLWFEGTTNQVINSDAPVNITQLRVDNSNKLLLTNQVNIAKSVDLMNNGKIELGTHNLVLASGAAISNYNASNYIITNNTGVLQQEVTGSNVVFPVGNSAYNPLTLSNTGTSDNFQLRVVDQVLTLGTAGVAETGNIVNRTWLLDEETAGGSVATITVQWNQAEELASFNRAASALSHWNGSAWDHSMTYNAATNAGGTTWTQTRSGQASFSPFAVEDLRMDLPVELLNFDAERTSFVEVDLTWSTASETNNKGFHVQRMLAHETEFTTIGFVDGQGTSTVTNYYQFFDPNPYTGYSYYRLQQEDFDGSISYSNTRVVDGSKDKNATYLGISIYPNPVEDQLNIRFQELPKSIQSAKIQIIGVNGQILKDFEQNIQAYQVLEIDFVQQLIPAMYELAIYLDNGEKITHKFIKK